MRRRYSSRSVGRSVCLTSGASVRPGNTVTYSAGNGGENICGVFFETAPFKSYGVKRKRKSQLLIRTSLLRDQVFLFDDVQRSTAVTARGSTSMCTAPVKAIALPAANQ